MKTKAVRLPRFYSVLWDWRDLHPAPTNWWPRRDLHEASEHLADTHMEKYTERRRNMTNLRPIPATRWFPGTYSSLRGSTQRETQHRPPQHHTSKHSQSWLIMRQDTDNVVCTKHSDDEYAPCKNSSRLPFFISSVIMYIGSSMVHTAYSWMSFWCRSFFIICASARKSLGSMVPAQHTALVISWQ
jgi:hypothetical protein